MTKQKDEPKKERPPNDRPVPDVDAPSRERRWIDDEEREKVEVRNQGGEWPEPPTEDDE